jgi:predicted alpha-1,2-mannosidase
MIDTMRGERKFVAHLDSLFTMNLPDKFFAETEDVTREGIIGNYVHGNEPAHHAAYLYNWTTEPWKTQARVRMILKNQYSPSADGLRGNDDCGQMSAWYIFTSLGFYPVAPGSADYALGSPLVKSATLTFENGNKLNIIATNQSDKNVYVKSVTLNGKKLDRFIKYDELIKGGKLEFEMSSKPVRK